MLVVLDARKKLFEVDVVRDIDWPKPLQYTVRGTSTALDHIHIHYHRINVTSTLAQQQQQQQRHQQLQQQQ